MSSRFWLHFRKQKRHMPILSKRCQFRHIVNLFTPELIFILLYKRVMNDVCYILICSSLWESGLLVPANVKRTLERVPSFGINELHYCVSDSLFLSFFGTPSRPNSSSYASKIARATGVALLEPKPPSGITTATASFGLLRGA